MTEFLQLENLDVYKAINPAELTVIQKKAAPRAINVFKEKRNETLKGRTRADGRFQRNMYDESPDCISDCFDRCTHGIHHR